MFRTIKLKLPYDKTLIEMSKRIKESTQIIKDYGFENKTFNKNKLNKGTYRKVRKMILTLPSALVQTAEDTASEAIKANRVQEENKEEIPDNKI
ncbi:MAG: hypothetical protein ACP5H0_07890 [Caldisericum sp.]|uniref:hypothetical protein n=1 Tax=Caldisericum sp. TaxID=2499687 RepID=UPI003D127422